MSKGLPPLGRLSYVTDPISRRAALKLLGLGAAALQLPACSSAFRRTEKEARFESVSPIDRSFPTPAPRAFSGDRPDDAHRVLWNRPGFLESIGGRPPEPTERVPLVVIGGGISGLSTAYLLRHHQPVVLERANRFGGNARGESWEGIDYSIGAAYFMEPEEGGALQKFLSDLGIEAICRKKTIEDPIVWQGKRYADFWSGATAPSSRTQFRRMRAHFEDIFHERNGLRYPDIPVSDPADRKYVESLDRVSFKTHLEKGAGGRLHSHLETAIEHFCWSSFGAPASEIGAASGLNFYTSELGGAYVPPGGNAAIAEILLARLAKEGSGNRLRADSLVFDVRRVDDGVVVSYVDRENRAHAIHARAVVMACSKFVASRILPDLEPERTAAIRKLRYNSYLVANVLLDRPVKDDFYDLFMIGEGATNSRDARASAKRQGATDIVLGTYARPSKTKTVLTLYRPLPYVGARGEILSEGAYSGVRTEFENQIDAEILPLLGCASKDVVDLRLARWGHPLPTAATGLIADGTIDRIRLPFRERVFFVNQDNWMLPAFETAVGEALAWVPEIEKFLR